MLSALFYIGLLMYLAKFPRKRQKQMVHGLDIGLFSMIMYFFDDESKPNCVLTVCLLSFGV